MPRDTRRPASSAKPPTTGGGEQAAAERGRGHLGDRRAGLPRYQAARQGVGWGRRAGDRQPNSKNPPTTGAVDVVERASDMPTAAGGPARTRSRGCQAGRPRVPSRAFPGPSPRRRPRPPSRQRERQQTPIARSARLVPPSLRQTPPSGEPSLRPRCYRNRCRTVGGLMVGDATWRAWRPSPAGRWRWS
jgi:hypothetical protein